MLFFILFLIILIVFFLLRHPKNIYALLYSLEMLAICIIVFANIIYALRFCQYSYTYYWEYKIYMFMSKMPISFFDIRILINISLLIFVCTSTILIIHNLRHRNALRIIIGFLIPFVGAFQLLYLNSPRMIEKIYILKHTNNSFSLTAETSLIQFLNIIILLYNFFPCGKLTYEIHSSKIIFKKRHLSLLLLLHTVFYSIYLSLLLYMPARTMFNNFDLYNITKRVLNEKTLLSIGIIFFFSILLMLFFNFEALNEKVFHADITAPQKAVFLSTDIRHVFHSYKNTVLSIKLLAEKALASYGTQESLDSLNNICCNADVFLKKAHRFLDIYNNVNMEFENVDILECLDNACGTFTLPTNIKLVKKYDNNNLTFYGDKELITEVMVNLISNAVDSINKSKKVEGNITLTVWSENPWICVDITDNGVGIPKNIQKKIFNPLFSTKKSMNNWGLGLSYVKNVLDAHSGYIHLRSKNHAYAQFQVTLPLDTIQ